MSLCAIGMFMRDNHIGIQSSSIFWKMLAYVMETVGLILTRTQVTLAYALIAATLISGAQTVGDLISQMDPDEADETCRRATILSLDLDAELSRILRFIHLEYTVRLLTQIPVFARELTCGFQAYLALDVLARLHAFLLVIHSGDHYYGSLYRLRQTVRKILVKKQYELQPFLRVDQGVRVLPSTLMNFRSCCALLGVCSSFSFMTYQYIVSFGLECEAV